MVKSEGIINTPIPAPPFLGADILNALSTDLSQPILRYESNPSNSLGFFHGVS